MEKSPRRTACVCGTENALGYNPVQQTRLRLLVAIGNEGEIDAALILALPCHRYQQSDGSFGAGSSGANKYSGVSPGTIGGYCENMDGRTKPHVARRAYETESVNCCRISRRRAVRSNRHETLFAPGQVRRQIESGAINPPHPLSSATIAIHTRRPVDACPGVTLRLGALAWPLLRTRGAVCARTLGVCVRKNV